MLGPRAQTTASTPSVGPQEYAEHKATSVRIVDGFAALLPGRTRTFFERQYFANVPKPIAVGGAAGWPREIPIAVIQAPKHQSIVIRTVAFGALQASGIGATNLAEVPPGRTIGVLGFKFTVGNRSLLDFSTNLPGFGVPITFPNSGGMVAPRAGQGSLHQGTGPLTPNQPGEPFAGYAMPGDGINATAVLFNAPDYDLRVVTVKYSGWIVAEALLQKIIDSLSGGC